MNNATATRKRLGSRKSGVALVLVLAFIVLLSILVVSFIAFSRLNGQSTVSYASSIQAQEIAQGGLQDILGDLHSEIIAGSVVLTNNSSTYPPVYLPITNYTAAPARLGYSAASFSATPSTTTLPSTVVRVSRASQDGTPTDLYPLLNTASYYTNIASVPGGAIPNRASAAHTSTPSSNGRYISAMRWNAPYLLAATTGTSTGGAGLQIPSDFANNMPDWVYVTRTGSRACVPTDVPSMKQIALGTTPPSSTTASTVVGRYAYVVYDEGALLDANVAGTPGTLMKNSVAVTPLPTYTTPTSATVPANLTVTGKSYETFADLMQLPGFAGSGTTGQNLINAFVNWRNAGSIATTGTTGVNFLQVAFTYAQSGFLNFQSNSGGSISDSPLVSRQDLINYFANPTVDPHFNTSSATFSAALPYLGTFSRAVSAPTWTPTLNSSQDPNYQASLIPSTAETGWNQNTAAVLYKNSAETAGFPNRDMPNVRFANTGAITHYNDDTTTASYMVSAGDPLLQSRFSLARISWLKDQSLGGTDPSGTNPVNGNGPSTAYATAIQACFGLVWGTPGTGYSATSLPITAQSTSTANGGNPCWNYVGSPAGPSGTLVKFNGTIETLDQVAAEGREPNFFELLKAAILNGSLGLSPGLAAYNNGQDFSSSNGDGNHDFRIQGVPANKDLVGSAGLFSGTFGANGPPTPASIPDMQIMQIGVNIIDQYGSDNFPTAIYFPYLSASTLPGGAKSSFDPVAGNGAVANALFGPVTMVYGQKNIPLLSKVVETITTPNPSGSLSANGVPNTSNFSTSAMEGWLQPELWNPNQQPNSPLSNTATNPVNFEIRAYGSAYVYSYEGTGFNYAQIQQKNPPAPGNPLGTPGTVNYENGSYPETYYQGQNNSESPTTSSASGGPQAGTLVFSVDNTQYPFYIPRLLTTDTLTGVTVDQTYGLTASTTLPTSYAGSGFPYYGTQHAPAGFPTSPTTYYNHFAGFSAGVDNWWYVTGSSSGTSTPTTMSLSQVGGGYTGIDFQVVSPYPTSGVSFVLGWYPSGQTPTASNFHPYSFVSGCFLEAPNVLNNGSTTVPDFLGDVTPVNGLTNVVAWGPVDVRSDRIPTFNENASEVYNADDFPDAASNYSVNQKTLPGYNSIAPTISPKNFVSPTFNSNSIGANFPQDWLCNTSTGIPRINSGDWRMNLSYPYASATVTHYADPDGVVRPADGGAYIDYMNLNSSYVPPTTGFNLGIGLNQTTYDGAMLFLAKGVPTAATASASTDPVSSTDNAGVTQHGRRPVILNRPFRSIGELGYVNRDLPFKTLDFFSMSSADAALLDIFSLTDESKVTNNQLNAVVAGQVNVSNAPQSVLKAILSGGAKKDIESTYNLGPNVTTIAQNCANALNPSTGTVPLLNRSALATQLQPALIAAMTSVNFNTGDMSNKAYLEAPVRALADVTNTRTWNLMIDVIAQSGEMSPQATNLDNFVVQGEKRYWLHIAIDRYTGKVVDQQLEPVYE